MLRVPRPGNQYAALRIGTVHWVRTMSHLTRHDYASALQLLARVEARAVGVEDFARAVVLALHHWIAAEWTTLSLCDRVTGHRRVVRLPGLCPGADEFACFDQHFFDRPLVRPRGLESASLTRRIAGLFSLHPFQRRAPTGEGGRRVGPPYALSIALFSSPQALVTVELNRRGRDFDERDRERLELLRPHLAFLYRHARKLAVALPAPQPALQPPPPGNFSALTLREGQVMHWLACGKTDTEIGALLSISPRTVQKHLEHVYVKLGVETRTAAVMRARASQGAAPGGIPP